MQDIQRIVHGGITSLQVVVTFNEQKKDSVWKLMLRSGSCVVCSQRCCSLDSGLAKHGTTGISASPSREA